MQRALDDFVESLHADAGDIKVHDADGWVVINQNGFGPEMVGMRLAEEDAPVAVRVYAGRKPVAIADYSKAPSLYTGFPRANKLTATLAVPLIVRDEVVGALFAQMTTGPRAFTDADIDSAVRMASWISLAVDNARLLDAERVRVARVEALNEVSSLIMSSLEPGEAARRGLDYVVSHLGISAAAAWQKTDHATMELIASANFPQPYVDYTRTLSLDAPLDNVKVAVTGESVVAEDLAQWNPSAQERFASFEVQVGAYAIVPIVSKTGVIGALGFTWSEPRPIPKEEVDFYCAIAAQLGLALENARLFEIEKRELARTQLLHDLTLSVATETEPTAVANAAISALQRHLGIKIGDVRALDNDGKELVLLAYCGVSHDVAQQMARLPLAASGYLATEALRTKRLMTHEDEVLTPERIAMAERTGVMDDRYVQIPLVQQDEAVGTFGLVFKGRRSFTEEETTLYQVVAGILAQAIQNARLFQIERVRAARMEVLRDVTELVTSSLEPDEVTGIALASAVEHIGVRAASVWLRDETPGTLKLTGASGFPDEFFSDFADGLPIDAPYDIARAVQEGKPVIHEDAASSEVPPDVAGAYRRYGIPLGALIVLPLRVGEEVVGALTLAWEQPRRFDSDSIAFDVSLANAFSTALANARLFEEARESGRRVNEIINSMGDAFVSVDREWRYTLVNPRGVAMLGRSAEDLIGKRMDEEFPDVAGWPHYRKVMEERVPVSFESYAEMAHSWVEVHAYPTLDGISMYVSDITKRKTAEERIRRDAKVLSGINSILEASLVAKSAEELGEVCLGVVEEVTGSAFGFIGEIGEDGLLHDLALSDPGWEACAMRDKTGHGRPPGDFQIHGLYGRVLKDGSGFFTNTPAEHPDSIGTPEGHPPITAFLGAPLDRQGRTVGLIALSNRPGGYGPDDLATLEAMTTVIAQALERVQAARLLVETRRRADMMAEFVENASVSFGVGTPDGEVILTNHAFEELTGYTAEELRTLDWARDLTPPEYADMEAGVLAELARTGDPVQYEKEYIRKDGTRVPIELLANATLDEAGNPLFYYSFITDITQRKAAQESLDRANRLLDAHISNSPLAVVEFDAQFNITRWSDGAERTFGWKAEEVLGKAMTELKWTYEEDAPLVENESARLLTGETPRSFNVNRNYRKDGSVVWCEWYDSAIYDDDGSLVSVFSQVLDITDRRNAEQAVRDALAEAAGERTRLRQIIDEIPVGVALIGPSGAVLEVNDELNRIWGGVRSKAENVEGFAAYEGYHHGTNERLKPDEWPGPRAIQTRRPEGRLIDLAKLDHGTAVVRVSALPIFEETGELTRVVVIIEDVSEQIAAQRLTAALNEISLEVASTLEDHEIIQHLTASGCRALGTQSAAAVVRRGGEWVLEAAVGVPEDLIGRGLRSSDVEALQGVIQQTEPVVAPDAQRDPRVSGGKLAELGATSLIALPLISHGSSSGALFFWHTVRTRDFSEAQLEFARKLMTIATLALDNAHLYEREHHIAETLQQAILTPPEPVEGLEISYLYRPASDAANVGGDFYEVVAVGDDRIGFVVGDVSGKGIDAARFTTLMKNGARAFLLEGDDPAGVLKRLNSLAWRSTPVERFATAFLGVLEVSTGSLVHSGAGHPPALVMGSDGVRPLASCAGVLGAWEGLSLETSESVLTPGDVLVMYTDGVTEARRGKEFFGEARLVAALEELRTTSIDELPRALLDTVLDFSSGGLRDDIVILCLARRP